jgi:tricorn protease
MPEIPSNQPLTDHLGPRLGLSPNIRHLKGDLSRFSLKNTESETYRKRPWGGVVGIRGTLPFIDDVLNKPEFSTSTKGMDYWRSWCWARHLCGQRPYKRLPVWMYNA